MFKKFFSSMKDKKYLSLLFVAAGAIVFYVFLQRFDDFKKFLDSAFSLISPFIWGAVIAYLLNPIAKFFERTIFGKFKKRRAAHTISVLMTFILAIAAVALLMVAIVPQIASSVMILVGNLEGYFALLQKTLNNFIANIPFLDEEMVNIDKLVGSWEQIFKTVTDWIINNIENIIGVSYKVGSGVFNGAIAVIFSVYVLLDKNDLKRLARRLAAALLPAKPYARFGEIVRKSNSIFLGYIGGTLLDSLIVGVANYLFMLIMGMPYALLITAIVAVTNLIPNFGPFIGAVPSVLILLLIDPWDALWFVVFTVVLQFLDGNVIKPLLFSDSTGLRPVWVLVAIIVGGGVMGIVGMLIGVPLFAIIFYLLNEWLETRLPERGFNLDGHRVDKNGNPIIPIPPQVVTISTSEPTPSATEEIDIPHDTEVSSDTQDAPPSDEAAPSEASEN
ncbi:MAG: AI-2E family transporter [Oscillospiraceae bacterium]|nr:AI-2E family transporter [Oscillospiraceae bacterium]MBQ9937980.1 AI-2E family transporter [Oscillospiraceae bacterium]